MMKEMTDQIQEKTGVENFRFLHICHAQQFEIFPHDKFFLHGYIRGIGDKYQVWKRKIIENRTLLFFYFIEADMVVEIWYDRKWVSIPRKWLECFYWILNWEQEHFDICSGGKSLYELQWGKPLHEVEFEQIWHKTIKIPSRGSLPPQKKEFYEIFCNSEIW